MRSGFHNPNVCNGEKKTGPGTASINFARNGHPTQLHERFANANNGRAIHGESLDGRPAGGGLPDQATLLRPTEVIGPVILAWMEQGNKLF